MSKQKDDQVDEKPSVHVALQQETKGGIIPIESVQNVRLVCLKDKKNELFTGYAFVGVGNAARVVLKENQKRTTSAGKAVWLVHSILPTKKGIIAINSTDFEFNESQVLDNYQAQKEGSGKVISQKNVISGSFICFSNKKGEPFCGYAFRNGSNIRVVCSDKERRPLESGKKVWQSDQSRATNKKLSDSFNDTDFTYDEDAVKKNARDAFDLEETFELIKILETKVKKLQIS